MDIPEPLTPGRTAPAAPSRTYRRAGPGAGGRRASAAGGYWARCRGASAAVVLVLPLLAAYEGGIAALGGAEALRAGVDAWIVRLVPGRFSVPGWAPSMVIALGLIAWRVAEPGRFRPRWAPIAAFEGVLLGAGLLAAYLMFDRWNASGTVRFAMPTWPGPIGRIDPKEAVGLIGAGVFEEAVFRLGVLGIFYAGLRVLHVPNVLATALAVSGSALAFSAAHHVGEAPGTFVWPTFVFRWIAGVYFAWVRILRGFGIAVGTHVAYDLLVAAYPWPDEG